LKVACAALIAVIGAWYSGSAHADTAQSKEPPSLIYFDNDFQGPGQSNIQALIPLLQTPGVKLLGIGVVTGDAWVKEECAHILRFLELTGHADIPVAAGAEMPLLRNQFEMQNWEIQYGRIPWKGAWNAARAGETYHPDEPDLIPPMPEGEPTTHVIKEDAPHFLIRLVHEHPGQITVVACGPLTNIALAVRLSPDLPQLAKEIVFEGGDVDTNFSQVSENADNATDFNFLFDPEAARIVVTAPWRRITAVEDGAAGVIVSPQVIERISAVGTQAAKYFKQYAKPGQPFWDSVAAAVAVDRSLVSKEVVARMDVDLEHGPEYGHARIWNDEWAPHSGLQAVHIVESIDNKRFLEGYIAAISR
jgi:inosine-uridine nucleoside N-ribohydrolase